MTNRIKILITGDATSFSQAAGQATGQIDQLDRSAGGLTATLGNVRAVSAAASAVIGGVFVASVGSAAKAIYEASAAGQRLQTMLNFASGGQAVAELAYLQKITAELGLEFASTAQAYGKFQAAARGTALEGQKAREVFEAVAKASAVMGLSADETSGVLLALQQMVSKGTVQSEELRGQLGERLPGAFQLAAKAMGVTTAELGKMLEQGEVVADEFLPRFAKALTEQVGAAADKAADRLDAAVNRFDNAWERLKRNAGDAGVSEAIADGLGSGAGSLDAISVAMERARMQGDGFFGQMWAGAVTVQKLMDITERATVNMYDNAKAIQAAEAELAKLQARGDATSGNIYIRASYADAVALVEKLREAKAAQDQISTGQDPRSAYNQYPSRSRSIEEYAASQDKARADRMSALAAVTSKVSGVNQDYVKSLQAIQAAREAGDISEARSIELLTKLAQQNHKVERSASSARTEAQSFTEQLGRQAQEIEAQAATYGLGETALVRYKAQQLGLTQVVDQYIARIDVANAALARYAQAEQSARDAAAWREATFSGEQDRSAQIRELEREIAAIGKSEVALHALAQARLLDNAAAVEAQAIRARDRGYDDQAEALQKEADQLRQIAKLREEAFFKRTTDESANSLRDSLTQVRQREETDWAQMYERLGQSLSNSLFDGGKSALELLKGYARSAVMQIPAQFVLKPVANAAQQLLGGGSSSGSPMGGGGIGSIFDASGGLGQVLNGSGISGIGSAFSSGAFGGGLTGLVGSGLSSLGSAMGWTSLSGFGAGLTGAGTLAGSTALSMGTAGASLGATVGAAIPYIGWAMALASMLGNRNKWTKNFGEASVTDGLSSIGQTATFDDLTEAGERNTFSNARYSAGLAGGTQALAQSISDLSRMFGGSGSFSLAQAASVASKKDSAESNTAVFVNGEYFETGSTKSKKSEQGQVIADQALRATVKILQETVTGRFGEYFDSIDALKADIPELQSLIETAKAVQTLGESLEWLGGPFDDLSTLSVQATADLAAAAGGYDALLSQATAAYQILMTEEERAAELQRDVAKAFAELNLTVPESRDAFLNLLSGIDQSSDAGARLYAQLLQLVPAWDQAGAAARQAAEEAVRAAQQSAGWTGRYGLGARAGLTPAEIDTRTESQDYWEYAAANNLDVHSIRTLQAWRYQSTPDPQPVTKGMQGAQNVQSFLGSTAEAFGDVADSAKAAEDRLKSLGDLLRAEREDLLLSGMSELDRSLAGVAKQLNETIASARELGATEEDLAVIRRNAARRSAVLVAEAAFATLERSIAAAQVGVGDGLRDAIEQSLQSMRISLPERAAMDRQAAQAQIQAALAIQRAGGPAPKLDDLRRAIETVTANGQDNFSTSLDYSREYYATRRNLRELGGLGTTDPLLANGEDILKTAREQLDQLMGLDRSVLSVADAMAAYDKAIQDALNATSLTAPFVQQNEALQRELKTMREEIQNLRADNAAAQAAIASFTNKTQAILDKWDNDGMPATTTATI